MKKLNFEEEKKRFDPKYIFFYNCEQNIRKRFRNWIKLNKNTLRSTFMSPSKFEKFLIFHYFRRS